MSILLRLKRLESKIKSNNKVVLYYIYHNGELIETNENQLTPIEKEKATTVIIRRSAAK